MESLMTIALQMLQARPDPRGVDHAALAEALEALNDVALAATNCADSCLVVEPPMVACVQVCSDAADVAAATARVLSRSGPTVEGSRRLVDAAAMVLSECADECERHIDVHQHCRVCADACRRAQRSLSQVQAEVARSEMGESEDRD